MPDASMVAMNDAAATVCSQPLFGTLAGLAHALVSSTKVSWLGRSAETTESHRAERVALGTAARASPLHASHSPQ